MTLLAAGADQTCAATGTTNKQSLDPSLQCWGDSVGSGYGLSSQQSTPAIPVRPDGKSTIQYAIERLAVGAGFACVKRLAEGVECLGVNDVGQLGGTPPAPGETAAVGLSTFPAGLASGSTHSCAVLPDGRLQCWGRNDAGQLGNASTTDPGVGYIVVPVGQ
jgi:alpha-tubulin suppressor-like RCC1 family protein